MNNNRKLGIMQPYFFPYIGYFQLVSMVDIFVIYDNIQYTKKGWINRNRYLCNGVDKIFTLPLKKDSDYLDVVERTISPSYERKKLLGQLEAAYKKAPYIDRVMPLVQEIINYRDFNLFHYIYNSVVKVCEYLNINTKIIKSSTIPIDHSLKSQDKVIALCKELKADTYINSIGGIELYDKNEFSKVGIELKFFRTDHVQYTQFNNEFIPNLSIIDVMMFNSVEQIHELLTQYELL